MKYNNGHPSIPPPHTRLSDYGSKMLYYMHCKIYRPHKRRRHEGGGGVRNEAIN